MADKYYKESDTNKNNLYTDNLFFIPWTNILYNKLKDEASSDGNKIIVNRLRKEVFGIFVKKEKDVRDFLWDTYLGDGGGYGGNP